MASFEMRDAAGKKAGSVDLPAEIFESTVSVPLMHQVVVAGLAGIRAGTHSTKTRAQVRGGGKKPWRQKGTGRARQGSIRSPQWVGGGVAHGPHAARPLAEGQQEDAAGCAPFRPDRRAAERQARRDRRPRLDRAEDEGRRRRAHVAGARGRILLVLPQPTESGSIEKSFRNLPNVKIAYSGGLGTYDVLLADRVLFTGAAIDRLAGKQPEQRAEAGVPEGAEEVAG